MQQEKQLANGRLNVLMQNLHACIHFAYSPSVFTSFSQPIISSYSHYRFTNILGPRNKFYMCICTYHTHTHIHTYTHTHTHTLTCMHKHMCKHTQTHTHTYKYIQSHTHTNNIMNIYFVCTIIFAVSHI